MAYLNPDIMNNLYKDFIGANRLTDRLNFFYDGKAHQSSFPPYNILEYEDGGYEISLALAGYKKSEVTIENENNTLTVKGTKEDKISSDRAYKWVWGGIANRNFVRQFLLEDNIKIVGAEMVDGILTISLQKIVPDKPKTTLIAIK
jgi:molecular chaperone IbpA